MIFDNGRGIGITDAVHTAADWPVLVFSGLLTQLGDGWFLFLLGGTLYVTGDQLPRWGIERRRGLFVLGLVFMAVALTGTLKAYFQLPRPPYVSGAEVLVLPSVLQSLFGDITTADGYGFPSGHALGSTMVWGGCALVLQRGSFGNRVGAAGVIVLLVAVSRLVLGVHYLVDVIVGVVVGGLVLGSLYRLTDGGTRPGWVLLVATGVGLLGVLLGVTFESVAATGGAGGAWVVWRAVADSTPAHPTTRRAVATGFGVLGAVGGLFVAIATFEPPLAVTFLGSAVGAGGAVGAPLLGERLAAT
ncbi:MULTISPECIES: phosphatase PAP2 family protein [Haloarcula]|uniref:phosphatase PAP2 family protein n=1 Tax=Haloarcula TaxID=2237 RepID=UPI0023EC2D10|nr:phosphatase PAP2 family protein [Halomicroarcula sp. XH51]